MPKYPPLNYREVVNILKKLGFIPKGNKAGSHQTWTKTVDKLSFAVTVADHGVPNKDVPNGTLKSMIRQSGHIKADFYKALGK
jgi:predicted RNA binding protein YcfA (HicA-like mRNA interferase family)